MRVSMIFVYSFVIAFAVLAIVKGKENIERLELKIQEYRTAVYEADTES